MKSVFKLEIKEESKETGGANWVKQKVPIFSKFLGVYISGHLIKIRRKKCMFLETKSLFSPIWLSLHSFPFGVPSAYPQSCRSPSMDWHQAAPTTPTHSDPKMELILEQGRSLALRGENPCRSSPSEGPDTWVSGERSPLPAMEIMGPVRPQRVSGSTFRRGENFHWSMVLATIISLSSEVIIIFYYCFRRLCFIRSGKSVYANTHVVEKPINSLFYYNNKNNEKDFRNLEP